MHPPDDFAVRRPTIDDIDGIWRLTRACDEPVLGFSDWSTDEVREQLESPRSPAATHHWLVTDPGSDHRAVGWGSSADAAGGAIDVDWYVDPALPLAAYRNVSDWLWQALLADAEARVRPTGATSIRLETGAYRLHTERTDELAALGFEVERTFFRLVRPLDRNEVFAPPPPGVTIRVAGRTEDDRRVVHHVLETAFRDHFNHHDRTFDEWWADQRNRAGVDLTRWRLAEIEGTAVGACICSERYADNDDGYIGSLGVLREARGRGVAKALLADAFACYRDAGRARVLLHVDSDSPTGATRLYEAVGMTPDLVIDFFVADHPVGSP